MDELDVAGWTLTVTVQNAAPLTFHRVYITTKPTYYIMFICSAGLLANNVITFLLRILSTLAMPYLYAERALAIAKTYRNQQHLQQ